MEEPIAPSSFNPKYLFANFVEGKSNELALAAAKEVAESPSLSYNPLVFYGGVGLGKTHLLHAIGHELQHNRPQLRVRYLGVEQFANELVNAIRFDRIPAFREHYRAIDVLMIDDIHFLADKERTQGELFQIFGYLHTNQKQIILSSSSLTRNILTLQERLRTFERGLIADIQPPDQATRMAILHRKAELEKVQLSPALAEVIANLARSDIRAMEGLFTRVLAFSSLTGKPLSIDLAREAFQDILHEEVPTPPAADIPPVRARKEALGKADSYRIDRPRNPYGPW